MARVSPSFTGFMVSSRISALRRLHGMLEHDQVKTREEFSDMMKAAFVEGGLQSRQLASDLGFTPSAVYRWIEGRSAPHTSLWPVVVKWIEKAIEAHESALEPS